MSNQLLPAFQQFFNANGEAEAGLVLHTYITNTLTNKETFQTFGGTANTNPIVLDASGYPPVGIYGSGTYRLILKDATGATLRDLNQVILTAGLQPDENGDYIIADNLDVQGTLTINGVLLTGDGLGNIAYNGATIPSDLDTAYNQEFYVGGRVVATHKTSGNTIDLINAYRANGDWKFIGTGNATFELQTLDKFNKRLSSASGVAGGVVTWETALELDSSGQLHLKTGTSPILFDL